MGEHGLATGTLRSLRRCATRTGRRDRGAVVEVSDRGGGTLRMPNTPWHFASADVGLRGEPRYRGEDNRAVLAELLARRRRARPAGGRWRAVQPDATPMTLRFPVSR